jgi:hypothetical protein
MQRSEVPRSWANQGKQGIYPQLVLHQCNEEWHGRGLFNWLHEWAVRFNVQFNLNVPQITLGIEVLRADVGAHFRLGHNAFGLKGEIILNALYLDRPQWWLLGVLLHEELHGWQQAYGTIDARNPNYHNREYRDKAKEIGLSVDRYGRQTYLVESKFFDLLRQHGVDLSDAVIDEGEVESAQDSNSRAAVKRAPALARGNSKLKKWSCDCTNVRVGVADFHAQCLNCGQVFKRQDR